MNSRQEEVFLNLYSNNLAFPIGLTRLDEFFQIFANPQFIDSFPNRSCSSRQLLLRHDSQTTIQSNQYKQAGQENPAAYSVHLHDTQAVQ